MALVLAISSQATRHNVPIDFIASVHEECVQPDDQLRDIDLSNAQKSLLSVILYRANCSLLDKGDVARVQWLTRIDGSVVANKPIACKKIDNLFLSTLHKILRKHFRISYEEDKERTFKSFNQFAFAPLVVYDDSEA